MFRNYFEEVWDLHFKWGTGVLYKEPYDTKSARIITSSVPGEWYNFAFPTVDDPQKFDLEETEKELSKTGNKTSIVLLEKHISRGFIEPLIRSGLKFNGRDSWMGYDKQTYANNQVRAKIVNVALDMFPDYDSVLGKVFVNFPGNPQYENICRKTISGELNGKFPGLKSELYLIYDDGKPVAGAGLFYSKEGNFAYLHDAGTLPDFRGRGYQSDLIRHRINRVVSLGIDRIYSSVEHGDQSWTNSIKCGLNTMHTGFMLVRN